MASGAGPGWLRGVPMQVSVRVQLLGWVPRWLWRVRSGGSRGPVIFPEVLV